MILRCPENLRDFFPHLILIMIPLALPSQSFVSHLHGKLPVPEDYGLNYAVLKYFHRSGRQLWVLPRRWKLPLTIRSVLYIDHVGKRKNCGIGTQQISTLKSVAWLPCSELWSPWLSQHKKLFPLGRQHHFYCHVLSTLTCIFYELTECNVFST